VGQESGLLTNTTIWQELALDGAEADNDFRAEIV
jgi:hypothetical protein